MAVEGCSLSPQKEKNLKTPAFRTSPPRLRPPVIRHPVVPSGRVGAAQLPASVKAPSPHPGHAARKGVRGEPMPLNEFRLHL